MYQLYIANKNYSSWSLRPWLLMQELDIDFNEHLNPFCNGSNWQQFRQFSPTGQVPCLLHEDQVVWDSLAITEYLAEKHPEVWPESIGARAWARSASAEMHAGFMTLRNHCPMNCGLRAKHNHTEDPLLKDIKRFDELWCHGLEKFNGPFLAGQQFTAVDAFYAPVAFRVQTYGLAISQTAQDYVSQILSLPGMQKWYKQALIEPWREPNHEQEVAKVATVLADHRYIKQE